MMKTVYLTSNYLAPVEYYAKLFAADPDYLQAAFERIDAHYGSFDQYLKTSVRIDDEKLAIVRGHLLT